MMITTDSVLLNNWHPVAKVEDCSPGTIIATRLLGEDLVVWRPEEPQAPIQVWQDYCPHRGACLSLGQVSNNTLVCAYHGWEYDTSGQCVCIPAHPTQKPPTGARIKTYHCRERYGLVWVCLGTPTVDIPPFPEWDSPDYINSMSGPHPINTSPFRMMENAIDIAHFPIIHKGILGDRPTPIEDYKVTQDHDGITISKMCIWLGMGEGNDRPFMLHKKLQHPLVEYTVMQTVGKSPQTLMVDLVIMSPVEEEKCLVWLLHSLNRTYEMLGSQTEILDTLAAQDKIVAACPFAVIATSADRHTLARRITRPKRSRFSRLSPLAKPTGYYVWCLLNITFKV